MAEIKTTGSEDSLIMATIKPRQETYYLVTDSIITEIKSKSSISSLFVFLASLMWGAFFSTIITINSGVGIKEETKSTLDVMFWVFGGFGLVFLGLTLYFFFNSRATVKNIKTSGEVKLEPIENKELEIIEAIYGADDKIIDISNELNSFISDGKLHYKGKYNDIKGDPAKGINKKLKMKYRLKGVVFSTEFNEDNDILIPNK